MSKPGRQWLVAVFSTLLVGLPTVAAHASGADTAPEIAIKAAFLYNFAKFREWPALPPGAPLVLCVAGSENMATALAQTVSGQSVGGHTLDVARNQDGRAWRSCHVLFIADSEMRGASAALNEIKALPVLTVSDGKGFADAGGMIELYVEDGRMRFAINVSATERSGLHLSSRLLGLAKVIRKDDVD